MTVILLMGWRIAVALLAVAVCPSATAHATSIVNGSFEVTTGMRANGELLSGSTAITGWTVFGTTLSNNVVDYIGPPWDVSDGDYAVDLDGRNALGGGIKQTFSTLAGQRYDVRFDLSGNPGDRPENGLPRVKQVRVTVDTVTHDYSFDSTGQTIQALTWDPIQFSFIATGGNATLAFMSLSATYNSYGPLIDNVRVHPTPEGGNTATVMVLGLAAVIALRRRAQG